MITKYKIGKKNIHISFIILFIVFSILFSQIWIYKTNAQSNMSHGRMNSSLTTVKGECLQKTDNQSCKFKKFGNFTQILQGTRLGFGFNKYPLNSTENGSKVISEFTP